MMAVGGQNQNHARKRAVEMAGLWKAWKAKSRLSPLTTAPWKSRQKQARFPHSHSSGDYAVEKWKTKIRFPTFPPRSPCLRNEPQTGGLRPPPSAAALRAYRARGYTSTMSVVVEKETRKLLTDVDHCFTL